MHFQRFGLVLDYHFCKLSQVKHVLPGFIPLNLPTPLNCLIRLASSRLKNDRSNERCGRTFDKPVSAMEVLSSCCTAVSILMFFSS
uniref:Uncharacterized protein n=1 Tax=Sander lucioperca TaxID=283035 RepID=A0A8C9YTI3_SANLU